jgi:DNA-binding transcriptional regulator YhcF (GntR family)
MLFRPNPRLGVPIYLQLMEQVKHAIETGALRPGDQLPGMRPLAEELVINPNTVAKAYRELEHEGVIELRHGAGAFVPATPARRRTDKLRAGRRSSRPRSRSCARAASPTTRSGGCSKRSWPGADRRTRWLTRSSSKRPTCESSTTAWKRLRGLATPGARRLHLRVPGTQRRRQDDDHEGAAGNGEAHLADRRVCSDWPSMNRGASVEIRRRRRSSATTRILYDYMTVAAMIASPPRSFRAGGETSRQRYLRKFELPPTGTVKALLRAACAPSWRAAALCRGAELLILDEPTSGLDPAMTEEVLQALVPTSAREEMTVFFSSHQIAEVDQIADRVAIIDRGRAWWPARSTTCGTLLPHPARVRRRRAGRAFRAPGVERVRRKGACSPCCRAPAPTRSSTRRARCAACRWTSPRHAEGDLPRDRHRGGD